jgi:hypothetical protein
MVRIAVAFACLFGSAPLLATPDPQPSTQAQPIQPAPEVKEKKICRADPAATGSLLPQRICHTQAEWDAITQSAQEQAEQLLQRQDQTSPHS